MIDFRNNGDADGESRGLPRPFCDNLYEPRDAAAAARHQPLNPEVVALLSADLDAVAPVDDLSDGEYREIAFGDESQDEAEVRKRFEAMFGEDQERQQRRGVAKAVEETADRDISRVDAEIKRQEKRRDDAPDGKIVNDPVDDFWSVGNVLPIFGVFFWAAFSALIAGVDLIGAILMGQSSGQDFLDTFFRAFVFSLIYVVGPFLALRFFLHNASAKVARAGLAVLMAVFIYAAFDGSSKFASALAEFHEPADVFESGGDLKALLPVGMMLLAFGLVVTEHFTRANLERLFPTRRVEHEDSVAARDVVRELEDDRGELVAQREFAKGFLSIEEPSIEVRVLRGVLKVREHRRQIEVQNQAIREKSEADALEMQLAKKRAAQKEAELKVVG